MFTVMALLLYLEAAVAVGAVVWRCTRGTWGSGTLSSHIARCVLLTFVTGMLWPSTLLVVAAYQHPSAREAIDRFIVGATPSENS